MLQHACPHCHQAAVSNLASTSSGIWVAGVVLLAATGFIALLTQSLWAGLAGLALVGVYNVWAWRHVELWPIDANSAQTAARATWLATVLAWLAVLFH